MYIPGPNPVIPPRECNVRDSVKDLVRFQWQDRDSVQLVTAEVKKKNTHLIPNYM